jgi:AraC-like DNA-binding protein
LSANVGPSPHLLLPPRPPSRPKHSRSSGLALHNVLIECVDKVCQEVGNEPGLSRACNYLLLISRGLKCREISKQLGLSREHVSRLYRKKAIELVTEEFLSIVNGK